VPCNPPRTGAPASNTGAPAPWSVPPEPFSWTRRPNSLKTSVTTRSATPTRARSAWNAPSATESVPRRSAWVRAWRACVSNRIRRARAGTRGRRTRPRSAARPAAGAARARCPGRTRRPGRPRGAPCAPPRDMRHARADRTFKRSGPSTVTAPLASRNPWRGRVRSYEPRLGRRGRLPPALHPLDAWIRPAPGRAVRRRRSYPETRRRPRPFPASRQKPNTPCGGARAGATGGGSLESRVRGVRECGARRTRR